MGLQGVVVFFVFLLRLNKTTPYGVAVISNLMVCNPVFITLQCLVK